MADYLQEKFMFTQMLIMLDKLICWALGRKQLRSISFKVNLLWFISAYLKVGIHSVSSNESAL